MKAGTFGIMKFALLLAASVASATPVAQKKASAASGPKVQPPAEGKLIPVAGSTMATMTALRDKNGELDAGLRPLVRNEVVDNTPCGSISFIFARASTEPNNMGGSMGPWICAGLKKEYGEKKVLCQGVSKQGKNGGYQAGTMTNTQPGGTNAAALAESTAMFKKAAEKCPNAIIAFGGYSQGTAVMHGSVGKLPEPIKAKIAGGVLFGDTRNKQDAGQIKGFPKDKIKIYCDKTDGVCGGTLNVTNGHFVYTMNGDGEDAVKFLVGKINARLGKSKGSSSAAKEEAAAEEEEEEAEPAPAKGKGKAAGAKSKGVGGKGSR